jgi:hypothetical protein
MAGTSRRGAAGVRPVLQHSTVLETGTDAVEHDQSPSAAPTRTAMCDWYVFSASRTLKT